MKETLRQTIQRLAADNQALREKNSALTTLNQMLSARINEADIRARKLIRSANLVRSTEVSERRLALEAARARAIATGQTVKV